MCVHVWVRWYCAACRDVATWVCAVLYVLCVLAGGGRCAHCCQSGGVCRLRCAVLSMALSLVSAVAVGWVRWCVWWFPSVGRGVRAVGSHRIVPGWTNGDQRSEVERRRLSMRSETSRSPSTSARAGSVREVRDNVGCGGECAVQSLG